MKFVLIFTPIFLLYSCAAIYGVNKPVSVNVNETKQLCADFNIKSTFILNDTLYEETIIKFEKFEPDFAKNLSQALLILKYNGENFTMFYPNCYAGGFPLLQWNNNNRLEFCLDSSFINHTTLVAEVFIQDNLFYNQSDTFKFTQSECIVVFYNYYLRKQSNHLINTIKEKTSDCQIPVVFVNNDQFIYSHYNKKGK